MIYWRVLTRTAAQSPTFPAAQKRSGAWLKRPFRHSKGAPNRANSPDFDWTRSALERLTHRLVMPAPKALRLGEF